MEQERNQILGTTTTQISFHKHQNPPKQSDAKGTAFRIRPQTPKLNLLGQKKKADKLQEPQLKRRPHHLEALPAIKHKNVPLVDPDTDSISNLQNIDVTLTTQKPPLFGSETKKKKKKKAPKHVPRDEFEDEELLPVRDDLGETMQGSQGFFKNNQTPTINT